MYTKYILSWSELLCPSPARALMSGPRASTGRPLRRRGLKFQSLEGYSHEASPEEKHEDEVGRAAAEGTLLQHAAVAEPAASVKEVPPGGASVSPLRAAPQPGEPPTALRLGPRGAGYTKSMLKKKLNPRGPKKRKLVTSLQTYGDGGKAGGQAQGRQGLAVRCNGWGRLTWNFRNTRCGLK